MTEDPRDLARRLAEEAKKRLRTPAGAAQPPAAPAPSPPERSLEQRAGSGRAKSALEALEAAREAERKRAATPASMVTPTSPTTPPTTNRRATPAPSGAARSAYAPSPEKIFAEQVPSGRVDRIVPVTNPDVFKALWRAHRARALHEGDGALVATASVLLDALDRIPAGRLHEARVTLGNEVWAAWIDADRGVLLGMARPVDVYLSGS